MPLDMITPITRTDARWTTCCSMRPKPPDLRGWPRSVRVRVISVPSCLNIRMKRRRRVTFSTRITRKIEKPCVAAFCSSTPPAA